MNEPLYVPWGLSVTIKRVVNGLIIAPLHRATRC
jgi:hypothetical protein